MKSAYTPGPWWGASMQVGTEPCMEVKIARVSGANMEQAKANLKLIAVAPEMAELLNRISNWLVCAPITTPEDMAQSFAPFQQEIDALLVKAGCQ